jgi:hypothetical protein
MKRRAFIAVLGSAAALPLVARAQQPSQARRIGVLSTLAADDPNTRAQIEAFLQEWRSWAGSTQPAYLAREVGEDRAGRGHVVEQAASRH